MRQDLTELQPAEERLRRDHGTFYGLIHNNPFGVYLVDADFCLAEVSLGASKVFANVRPLIGRDFAEVLRLIWPEPFATEAVARFRRTLDTGEPYSAPSTVERRADIGEVEAYDWRIERVVLPDGRFGVVCYFYDLSERQRWEAELVAAKAAAEEASRAKDQFLAVLSHELRTPLTPALAAAQALASDPRLDAHHRELASLIRRNIDLEARLIDDLLDLTRVARGKLELNLATVDVHAEAARAAEMCRADAAAKGLALELDLRARRHHVHADPARLQQVLWNLLKNAIKFTPAGGRIQVRTADAAGGPAEADRVQVHVIDTGVGVAPDALPRIFDAFEQGGTDVTRRFGGLGLGLAITKALVDAHGGSIAASSAGPGTGATFTVTLPTCHPQHQGPGAPHTAVTAPQADAAAPTPSARPPHAICSVLLVEDHADTRRILELLLAGIGCDVVAASTVAEALRLGQARPFDVVVSDIGLPDGTGLDLLARWRAQHAGRAPRAIALSGYGMEQDLARSRDAGFDAHLTKPVDFSALEMAIRDLLAPPSKGRPPA